jgi:integrase/recombinase XerC
MAHLKSFFKFLYQHDFIEKDPTRKMPTIKVPRKEIVYVPHDDIMKVLDNMFTKFRKGMRLKELMRDYLIIRCAYVTGWRASEAINCEIKKYKLGYWRDLFTQKERQQRWPGVFR